MSSPPPLPAVVCFPRSGGVDVVPSFLPLHVSDEHRTMTVEEFFGLEPVSIVRRERV